ncbi:hypothetical protein BKA80DRAFT_25747 [Phyllosticta citrichinensis]
MVQWFYWCGLLDRSQKTLKSLSLGHEFLRCRVKMPVYTLCRRNCGWDLAMFSSRRPQRNKLWKGRSFPCPTNEPVKYSCTGFATATPLDALEYIVAETSTGQAPRVRDCGTWQFCLPLSSGSHVAAFCGMWTGGGIKEQFKLCNAGGNPPTPVSNRLVLEFHLDRECFHTFHSCSEDTVAKVCVCHFNAAARSPQSYPFSLLLQSFGKHLDQWPSPSSKDVVLHPTKDYSRQKYLDRLPPALHARLPRAVSTTRDFRPTPHARGAFARPTV